jgi:hypothetical protein
MDDFLAKPVHVADLDAMVSRWLGSAPPVEGPGSSPAAVLDPPSARDR